MRDAFAGPPDTPRRTAGEDDYISYECHRSVHEECRHGEPRAAPVPGVVYETCSCGCHHG